MTLWCQFETFGVSVKINAVFLARALSVPHGRYFVAVVVDDDNDVVGTVVVIVAVGVVVSAVVVGAAAAGLISISLKDYNNIGHVHDSTDGSRACLRNCSLPFPLVNEDFSRVH